MLRARYSKAPNLALSFIFFILTDNGAGREND